MLPLSQTVNLIEESLRSFEDFKPTRILAYSDGSKIFYFEDFEKLRYSCIEVYADGELYALTNDQATGVCNCWEVHPTWDEIGDMFDELIDFVERVN